MIKAIQARHRHFWLGCPIGPDGEYSRYMHCFSRFQGRRRRPLYPIHQDIVVKLLHFSCPPHAACDGFKGGCVICARFMDNRRDCLGTATIIIGCCRPEDGSDFDLCEFWPNHNAEAGYEQFKGAGSLNVKKKKNDQCRFPVGCHKRFGRSADPELDLVDHLKAWRREAGLEPRPGEMQEASGSISGVSSVPSTFSAIAPRRVRFRPLAPADSGLHQRDGREGGGIGRRQ
jgi:hypothetical protein